MKKKTILLLYICTLFFNLSFGQKLYLSIAANSAEETRVIDSINYNKQFKNIDSLLAEKKGLQKKLYHLGYIESEELSQQKINDSTLKVTFILNNLYRFIHIYYKEDMLPENLLKSVSETIDDSYFSIPFNEIESKLNYINKALANQGTPFKTLQLKNIKKKEDDILRADLYVSDDTKRKINTIIIQGYQKFPKSFLRRFLKIRKDAEFDLETIKAKTETLNDLAFASQLKDPEVLFTKDSTTLYMYIEKKSSNTFDGFLGFGTNDNTNKIEFDGYLNLNLINNLNYGESFRLLYKSDENDQKTFEGNLKLPYLFGSPLGVEAQINIFKKDSSFTTVNQHAKLFYQINPKSKVLAGLSSTQSNNLLDNNTILIVDDYDTTFYNLGYNYVASQNYNTLFPIHFFFNLEAGIGNRAFENESQDQRYGTIDTYKIFNLNQKNSIYARVNSAFLFSDDYFFNELYRFGGINSIRGFEENSLFASGYALINTEYRYQLSSSIYVNTILDAAYYENNLSNIKEKLFGFGFGFGLLTNAGLLKFNYANGKNENQKFKFSDSKIHLSLIAKF